MNQNIAFGSYSPASAVLQPFREAGTGRLTGFYHTERQVPFVYFAPAGTPPAGGWPLAIFQHGINGSKEQALAVAPGFDQLSYLSGRVPAPFMMTLANGVPAFKTAPAAGSTAATAPREGYFQFDQPDATHSMLIDQASSPVAFQLAQRQMVYFVRNGLAVDPTVTSTALPRVAAAGTTPTYRVLAPRVMKVLTPRD